MSHYLEVADKICTQLKAILFSKHLGIISTKSSYNCYIILYCGILRII